MLGDWDGLKEGLAVGRMDGEVGNMDDGFEVGVTDGAKDGDDDGTKSEVDRSKYSAKESTSTSTRLRECDRAVVDPTELSI